MSISNTNMIRLLLGDKKLQAVLANSIHDARVAQGLTQKQLAHKAKMPPAQLSHYETQRRMPGPDNVMKIAKALSVDVNSLMEKSE